MPEMLTASKLAERMGVPAGELKKKLKEAGVKPDLTKGGCSYYDASKIPAIKKKCGL